MIMELMPSDTPAYMAPAWAGCVSWAAGDPGILEAFQKDTGNAWTPGRTSLDLAIDQACGAEESFVREFVLWVNENVWGPIDGSGSDD